MLLSDERREGGSQDGRALLALGPPASSKLCFQSNAGNGAVESETVAPDLEHPGRAAEHPVARSILGLVPLNHFQRCDLSGQLVMFARDRAEMRRVHERDAWYQIQVELPVMSDPDPAAARPDTGSIRPASLDRVMKRVVC